VTPPLQPRPIHRWKTLWLGLLVFASLLWAWVVSLTSVHGVGWCDGKSAYYARTWDGVLGLGIDRGGMLAQGFVYWHLPGSERLSGKLIPRIERLPEIAIVELMLPFWFLLLLFLIPWAALLAWRLRRMKSHAAAIAAALSSSP
jgi:hypothetical protein